MSELSYEQKVCFDAAMESRSLFISGPGGVGKSFVLKAIIEEFTARKRAFRVAASTGVAALNIGGSTIHSLLGTNIKHNVNEIKPLIGTRTFHKAQFRLSFLQTIIIDEISMLSGDYISMMDFWLRQIRNQPNDVFGGCQVIFCGDFLQLPPVEKGEKPRYRYAFQSPSWKMARIKTVDLTRSFRQEDQTFINALNRVRFGDYNRDVRKVFRPCIGRELEEPTHLVSTNSEASDINFLKLKRHPGTEFSCKPVFDFRTRYNQDKVAEQMIRDSLTDSPLRLKVGVPVLLLKNHREGLYVNGSRGRIQDIKTYEHGEIEFVTVKLEDSGEVVPVNRVEWEKVNGDNEIIAVMRHLPIRLGWALTIHKSQGLTLDNVEIDLSRGFACGQAYVALSRLKSLEGLALADAIEPSIVKADSEIVDFYDIHRINDKKNY